MSLKSFLTTVYTIYGGKLLENSRNLLRNYLETPIFVLYKSQKLPVLSYLGPVSIDIATELRLLQTQRQRRNEESPGQQPDLGK